MPRLVDHWKRLVQLYQKEIWHAGHLRSLSARGALYAALRVISITATVFNETKAASRAAALSFSSLLGLGPLVALTVLVAGFALDNKDPDLAANTLSRLINFVAPQVGQYSKLDDHPRRHRRDGDTTAAAPTADAASQASEVGTRNSERGTPTAAPKTQNSAPEAQKADLSAVGSAKAEPETPNPELKTQTPAPPAAGSAQRATPPLNPRLVRMMNNFINQGRSGSAGTLGLFSLILIVLLLFKTVEDTFNEIWGVRSGRSLLMRIVYYWTILTLGAVLFFASITLLSAGAFLGVFHNAMERLPFSAEVAAILQWSLPVLSFALLVILLTVFYRVIPHTRVFWRAAFTGALVVAALLMLNNYLAFLYVRRVILTESLYGSLGFPLVVMFGLYIFWLYVLIGGQISYAVQNVHFRNSQAAWHKLSETMRQRLLIVVLLTICRRFQACLPPVTASQLGGLMKIPTQILNECLNRLVDLKFITPVPPPDDASATDYLYQPARPLNRITLAEFKRLDDNFGDDPTGTSLEHIDPILVHYAQALDRVAEQDFLQKDLATLFADHPFDESRPPFALGERTAKG
ncbi:MAG TPA: YihY/virulence factor BrkB family protein [Opitutus sp.]|nr:YihY/virulence factor BrkB family protein [Opitutus sp.]